MNATDTLDDLDFRIVAALQVAPRADWHRIGRAVDASASTAARRWRRMSEAGLAWLTSHPMRMPGISPLIGVIEVDCVPGSVYTVAEQLVADPHVFGLAHLTGSRDLLVTAAFEHQGALARYVAHRLDPLEGVSGVRSQIATAVYTDGSRWRRDRLESEGRAALRSRAVPAPPAAPRADPDEVDLAIMTVLADDARQPLAELADRMNLSPTTVKRRLARLEAERVLVYRCEVARFVSGWPLSVTLWGSVPGGMMAQVAAPLIGMREIRFAATVTGPHNVLAVAWLRSLADLEAFEARLAARVPDVAIVERALTLWPMKMGGSVLDPQGRHIRFIPVRPWTSEAALKLEHQLLRRLNEA